MDNDIFTPKFKINQKVMFNVNAGELLWSRNGRVIGYSCMFPPMYIVLLDYPIANEQYEGWSGVAVDGSMLNER